MIWFDSLMCALFDMEWSQLVQRSLAVDPQTGDTSWHIKKIPISEEPGEDLFFHPGRLPGVHVVISLYQLSSTKPATIGLICCTQDVAGWSNKGSHPNSRVFLVQAFAGPIFSSDSWKKCHFPNMTFGEDKKWFPSNYISRSFLQIRGTFLSYKNFTLQVKQRPLKSYFCASVDYRSLLKFTEFLFQYRPFVINSSRPLPNPNTSLPEFTVGKLPLGGWGRSPNRWWGICFLPRSLGGLCRSKPNVCLMCAYIDNQYIIICICMVLYTFKRIYHI